LKNTLREVRRSAWTMRAAATAVEAHEGRVFATDAAPEGEGLLAIEIRQPIGPDTDLVLRPLSDWRDLAAIRVTGYDAGGAAIAEAPATATEAGIAFAYRARLGGKDVAYYRAEPGSRAPAPAAPSVTAERPATPADAGAGDPISAALGVASLAALLLGMAILVAYRRSRRSG